MMRVFPTLLHYCKLSISQLAGKLKTLRILEEVSRSNVKIVCA